MHALRRIVEEVEKSPKLGELREFTYSDATMSTMAVKTMEPVLHEILSRVDPPGEPGDGDGEGGGGQGQPGQGGGQGQGQGDPSQDGQSQGGGQGDQGGKDGEGQSDGQGKGHSDDWDLDAEPGDGQGDGEGEGDLSDGANQEFDPEQAARDAAEAAEVAWEEAVDKQLDEANIDRLVHQALSQAMQEAEDLEEARRGIGLEDGEWRSMPQEERMALAERLMTPEMQQLSKIIGQLKRYALGVKAQRIVNVPTDPYDVENSDEVLRALPDQFVYLAHPVAKMEFYRRVAMKELRVFKRRGTEEAGQGPIVACIDKSSSMSIKKMGWAMGVAEALRRFAADEDRDYLAMFFGTNEDRNYFEFPKGRGHYEKVLEFMGTVANGGTEFDGVLTEALLRATTHFDRTGGKKADILFITDGQAHLSDKWIEDFNAERARVGVRVYSVYIGGARDMQGKEGPVGLLNRISDVVIPVRELRPREAKAIFEGVA
jgi:uncharacterized protein with von Willebrand factor type A (vWA) domain